VEGGGWIQEIDHGPAGGQEEERAGPRNAVEEAESSALNGLKNGSPPTASKDAGCQVSNERFKH